MAEELSEARMGPGQAEAPSPELDWSPYPNRADWVGEEAPLPEALGSAWSLLAYPSVSPTLRGLGRWVATVAGRPVCLGLRIPATSEERMRFGIADYPDRAHAQAAAELAFLRALLPLYRTLQRLARKYGVDDPTPSATEVGGTDGRAQ